MEVVFSLFLAAAGSGGHKVKFLARTVYSGSASSCNKIKLLAWKEHRGPLVAAEASSPGQSCSAAYGHVPGSSASNMNLQPFHHSERPSPSDTLLFPSTEPSIVSIWDLPLNPH